MKGAQLANRTLFVASVIVTGAIAGAFVWLLLFAMNLGITFIWDRLPAHFGPYFPLVACLVGGLVIGLFAKKFGSYPEDLNQVMAKVKRDGRYDYDKLGVMSASALLPLFFGGSVGYSAIAAAIGALKGPKHGGANLMVNRQLKDILKHVENPEDDDEVREYLRRILRKQAGDGSGLIYGMGHAVYTISDPREVVLKQRARHLAYDKGFEEEYNMLCSIERLAPGIFAEEKGSTKPVCANVDLFSGLIYNMLGISEDIYTPLFAIARVPGWCAHRVEEVVFANRIIRPAYKYLGVRQKYKPIEER